MTNVKTLVADGEDLRVEEASFDAVVCRLGLMLFPDPLRGLREMQRALKPGGRAAVMVFGRPRTALKHAGLPPRDPFQPGGLLSLGKPGLLEHVMTRSGFVDVAIETVSAPFRLDSVKQYMTFIVTSAGPILQILGTLDPGARAAAWAEIEEKLAAFESTQGWVGPNELLIGSGVREAPRGSVAAR